jgi:hypothetical protein
LFLCFVFLNAGKKQKSKAALHRRTPNRRDRDHTIAKCPQRAKGGKS